MIQVIAALIGILLILLLIRFVQRLALVLLIGGLVIFAVLVVIFLTSNAGAMC